MDKVMANELYLYTVNTGEIYWNHTQPLLRYLAKKKIKGKYDETLALKCVGHLADKAAQRYTKEFGGVWYRNFTPQTRKISATMILSHYQENIDNLVWVEK